MQTQTQLLVQHQGGTTSGILEVRRSFKWSDLCHVLHPASETLVSSVTLKVNSDPVTLVIYKPSAAALPRPSLSKVSGLNEML